MAVTQEDRRGASLLVGVVACPSFHALGAHPTLPQEVLVDLGGTMGLQAGKPDQSLQQGVDWVEVEQLIHLQQLTSASCSGVLQTREHKRVTYWHCILCMDMTCNFNVVSCHSLTAIAKIRSKKVHS